MQLDQALTDIAEYQHRSNEQLVDAIQCIRNNKPDITPNKIRLENIVTALDAIKWNQKFYSLPHDLTNPGVQATYAIWELRDIKVLP